MTRKYWLGAILAALAFGSAATLIVERVRAAGIPATGALTYTGYLEEPNGTPVNDELEIGLRLFDAETNGSEVCEVASQTRTLVGGRFQIPTGNACTDAVRENPDLWVELTVGGVALGRAKVGAVPFAVEADRASNAVGPLDQRIAAIETASPSRSAFRATATTAQSIPNGGNRIKVIFDTVEYDHGMEFDAATGIFSPNVAGLYEVNCNLNYGIQTQGTSAYWEASLIVNGDRVLSEGSLGDGWFAARSTHGVLELAAGDQVYCAGWQDSAVPQPLNTTDVLNSFDVTRLAPLTP